MDFYRKVIEIMPGLGDAHVHLASAYEDAGRFEEAIAHWQEVLKLKSDRLFFLSPAASQLDAAAEIERLKELLKPKEEKQSPAERKKQAETEAQRYEKLSYRQVKAEFLSADRVRLYVGLSEGAVSGAPVTLRLPEELIYVDSPELSKETPGRVKAEFTHKNPRYLRGAVARQGYSFCEVALHKPVEEAPVDKLVRLEVSFDKL